MLALGRQLAQAATHPAVRATTWKHADVAASLPLLTAADPYDLVVLAYVLGELSPARLNEAVARAAAATAPDGQTLIVEPGTPEGDARVIAARQQLLTIGRHVTAPCHHDPPCPIPENDWCQLFGAAPAYRQPSGGQRWRAQLRRREVRVRGGHERRDGSRAGADHPPSASPPTSDPA